MSTQSNPVGGTAVRPRSLTVEDVMSRAVVSVARSATFHEITDVMRRHGISAVPVVDEQGALLGVVSEADLLFKAIPPPMQSGGVPQRGPSTRRRNAGGVVAADVMTAPVISVGFRLSLAAAIRLLQYHHIKRLVVLDGDDRMVGIVSRRDLLVGFGRSDAEIGADVREWVIPRCILVDPAGIGVEVDGGVVRLEGTVDRRCDGEALVHLVHGVDGVVEVESSLDYRCDDGEPALDATAINRL